MKLFNRLVLNNPLKVLIILIIAVALLGYKAKDFKIDASAETLLLQNDNALKYLRVINDRYNRGDYLVIAYTPKDGNLFSGKTLKDIKSLRDEIASLKWVSSVMSILDVPLFQSPPVPLTELASGFKTILSEGVDKKLAKTEFLKSPLYSNMLVSSDFKTSAIMVNLYIDEKYFELLTQRNRLIEKQDKQGLTKQEEVLFEKIKYDFKAHRDLARDIQHKDIAEIRAIMAHHSKNANLFLGGPIMIADDMVTFIKKDLKLFGSGVLILLIVTIGYFFRKKRWIFLPIASCAFSVVAIAGILAIFGWEITVISSNFISLQIIITIAINIHLIVRYKELAKIMPHLEKKELIAETVMSMYKPCLFAALTTAAGFGSLVLCDILPVINFGWMMIAGVIVSLIIAFILFPSFLMLIKKDDSGALPNIHITSFFAKLTDKHGKSVIVTAIIILAASFWGISRLTVENCFIDYFKDSTEIHRGLSLIDQKLGGSTPLEVIVDFPSKEDNVEVNDDLGEFSMFDEFEEPKEDEIYWFTEYKTDMIKKIHSYIDSLSATGKVLSPATIVNIAETLNDGKKFGSFELALAYKSIPDDLKAAALKPYVSIENNQVRFSIRVKDSEPGLKRDRFLKDLTNNLEKKFGLKAGETLHITGIMVLYNNLLQSLFESQILTLGATIIILFIMFIFLFKSFKIALIALTPNILSIAGILGFMGLANIPLNVMTITIAAISVGIAVDDTIHYIHRYTKEFQKDHNYINTLYRCHGSIGRAMLYTSIAVIIGFSILAFSNFIPCIYFGLLTSLCMLIALIASLVLLPRLIVLFKPMGAE